MAAKARTQHSDNPLKSGNESKKTTRELADRARPREKAVPVGQTVTGRGGADRSESSREADTAHPSQHGGVRGDQPQVDPRFEPPGERSGVKRSGPSPADEPSSERTGTAPDRSGGPRRTGKTGNNRNKPR